MLPDTSQLSTADAKSNKLASLPVRVVEHLISIGADVNVRWVQSAHDDLGHTPNSTNTPQWSRFVRLTLNIIHNTLALDAWIGGRMSLLHLAVGNPSQPLLQQLRAVCTPSACMLVC